MTYELAKSYLANVLPKIPKGDETTVWASFISSLSVMGGGALCGAVTWTLICRCQGASPACSDRDQ